MLFILIPLIVFIYIIMAKPHLLSFGGFFGGEKKHYSVDDKYNAQKTAKQLELDKLLEKISQKGLNSLSAKEKERLDKLSE